MQTTIVGRGEARDEAKSPGGELTIELRADGSLWARTGGEERAVWVRRCFPWSDAGRFVSLQDSDEDEFALVADPAALDPGSRAALETAMAIAGFVLEVTRVLEIEEEVEIRHWVVETRQGRRAFQTRLDDWPRTLPGGGLLIRDVGGDLYHFADPARLDRESRDLLWAFVD